jgi:guanylate cyclase soluble subunit beta
MCCLYKILSNKINLKELSIFMICIKYSLINVLFPLSVNNLNIIKKIMWIYTSPIMVLQYSNVNSLNVFKDLKLHYYLLSLIISCFHIYDENVYVFIIACMPVFYFILNLFRFKNLLHTKVLIQIWLIYSLVIVLEYSKLLPFINYTNLYVSLNIAGKGIWTLSINENYLNLKVNEIEDIQTLHKIIKIIDEKITEDKVENKIFEKEKQIIYKNIKKTIEAHLPDNSNETKQKLLKQILPYEFDNNYITNNKLIKNYDSIVVLMTDIVGYSTIAKKINNKFIYYILNEMYLRFDSIIENFIELQKIETIGDAYLIVGDLNNKFNQDIVIEKMIEIAHLFIKEIGKIKTNNIIKEIQIRIGISIGPILVGILGNKVPRMSVIGHAINLAARLQSSTTPNSICLSKEVYYKLQNKEKYNFTTKNINLKNIGEHTTFTIDLNKKTN